MESNVLTFMNSIVHEGTRTTRWCRNLLAFRQPSASSSHTVVKLMATHLRVNSGIFIIRQMGVETSELHVMSS
jgi:hypothetical protein